VYQDSWLSKAKKDIKSCSYVFHVLIILNLVLFSQL